MKENKISPFSFIIKNCKPFRLLISLHLFVIIYSAIDISLWPFISKLLINTVGAASRENVIAEATPIALLLVLVTFIPNLVWRVADYAWMHMTPALKKKIVTENTTHLMSHSTNFFQNNFTGSLANRIKDLSNCTPRIIEVALYNFFGVFLTLLIAFFSLFFIHKLFAFGLLFWAVLFILMAIRAAKLQEKMTSDIANQSSKIMGNIVDVLGNITNVKFFTNQTNERSRIAHLQDEYSHFSKKRSWFLLKFYTLHGLTFSIYFAFCILLLVWLYAQNLVTLGDFAMIFTINSWMIHAMWQAANSMRSFLEDWGTVKQALQIIGEPLEIRDHENARTLEIKSAKGAEIIFENVGFSYKIKQPLSEIKIIDWELVGLAQNNSGLIAEDIAINDEINSNKPKATINPAQNLSEKTFSLNQTLTIKAGEKIGLVGHSGGGKSTFVNLILRQFEINSGRILIDGQDISQVTQESLRAAIGVIPQDPTLFHRSLHDNIAYARNKPSELEIIDAAKKAHAHEFIQKLSQGYNSLVGERGVKLSGGQRQRIAIARAFLKNAPILILDEATSQLDSITENLIQESLAELTKNKTAIIIAHRLATLQYVDRILVFDHGKIVEDGSHLELLASNGVYKRLWDAQVGEFLSE